MDHEFIDPWSDFCREGEVHFFLAHMKGSNIVLSFETAFVEGHVFLVFITKAE